MDPCSNAERRTRVYIAAACAPSGFLLFFFRCRFSALFLFQATRTRSSTWTTFAFLLRDPRNMKHKPVTYPARDSPLVVGVLYACRISCVAVC